MVTNVGFRVTGMYFGAADSVTGEIRVDVDKEIPTVYDVMVEVAKKVQRADVPGVSGFTFDPIFPSETDSLNSITVQYTSAPKADYDAGVYFLQENKMSNPIHVFQYYLFTQNFRQKNNNNKTVNFNQIPPENEPRIESNDIVVWRQVAIMQGANGLKRVKSEMFRGMRGLSNKGRA